MLHYSTNTRYALFEFVLFNQNINSQCNTYISNISPPCDRSRKHNIMSGNIITIVLKFHYVKVQYNSYVLIEIKTLISFVIIFSPNVIDHIQCLCGDWDQNINFFNHYFCIQDNVTLSNVEKNLSVARSKTPFYEVRTGADYIQYVLNLSP